MPENETAPLVAEGKSVLVIDDDKSILRSLVKVLEKNGFFADTAETGGEAIEKSRAFRYDAALVDLRLPDMDGIEVLSKGDFEGVVKIVLTGYPSLVTGIQAMDKDADAYLRKPVRAEELIRLVKAKLTQRK